MSLEDKIHKKLSTLEKYGEISLQSSDIRKRVLDPNTPVKDFDDAIELGMYGAYELSDYDNFKFLEQFKGIELSLEKSPAYTKMAQSLSGLRKNVMESTGLASMLEVNKSLRDNPTYKSIITINYIDCAGVLDGDAVLDECGICRGNGLNDKGYNCTDYNALDEILNLNGYNIEGYLEEADPGYWVDGRLVRISFEPITIKHIPESIGDLIYLEKLDLGGDCSLAYIPETFWNLSNLKFLRITGLQQDSISSHLFTFTNLDTLMLSNNNIQSLPDEIENLINLKWLWIHNNKLTSLPQGIGNLSKLEQLYLWGNKLISLPTTLCNLPENIVLSLNGNCLSEDFHYDCIDTWGVQDGCD